MLTKGQITAIPGNIGANSCKVRIPAFETAASTSQAIIDAQIAVQPWVFGGYAVDDVVWLGFEHNHIDAPVVIGKVYLGAAEEDGRLKENINGVLGANTLKVFGNAELPSETKLGDISLSGILERVTIIEEQLKQLNEADTV